MTESPARADLHVAILFHESTILGAGVSILRAVEYLRRHGWTSSGWFPGQGPLLAESEAILVARAYAEKPIAVSLRGWRREPGILGRMRRSPGYVRALKRWLLETKPDVVHANSLAMLPEAAVARKLGFPIVLQVHELPAPGRKRDLTLRAAGVIADVLVGVSSSVTRMLQERAGRTTVVTVHNGVPILPTEREEPAAFIVGCLGHVSRTKGTDVFLEAAELALRVRPELRFEHVGPIGIWGDDEFDRRIADMAASPRLADSVAMLGWRPAVEALARWSLLVLPSRQEAFPLITLEAMASGVPVIATQVGGIPEQIVHLHSGVLVPPEDPAALAAWIVRLRDDHELRARLAAEATREVRAQFTLASQAEGLDRAYRLASERGGRRSVAARALETLPTDPEDPFVARRFISANKRACKAIERHLPHRQLDLQIRFDETVVTHMNALPPRSIVVDIGSGRESRFARYRRPAGGVRVIGVDVSREELAKNRDVDEKRVADVAHGLPFGQAEVDLIASRSVLEHLDDTEAFIADSARVLRPGAYSIHLFASKFAPFALLNSALPSGISGRLLDLLHPESRGSVGFRAHYDQTYPSGVATLLRRHGFEVVASEVSYYQSGYYNFFLPLYLLSALYELLLYAVRAENLAAKAMIVARKL